MILVFGPHITTCTLSTQTSEIWLLHKGIWLRQSMVIELGFHSAGFSTHLELVSLF